MEAVLQRLQEPRPRAARPGTSAGKRMALPAAVTLHKAGARGTPPLDQSQQAGVGRRWRPGRGVAGKGIVEYHNLYALGEVSAAAVLALSAPLEDEDQPGEEDADDVVRRPGRRKQHKRGVAASAALQSKVFTKVSSPPVCSAPASSMLSSSAGDSPW